MTVQPMVNKTAAELTNLINEEIQGNSPLDKRLVSAAIALALTSVGGSASQYAESAPLTIQGASDFDYRFTHGLGERPQRAGAWMQCKVANNGYSVGDRIFYSQPFYNTGKIGDLWIDNTEVGLSWDGSIFGGQFSPKSGSTAVTFSVSDWDLILWAST